jgi:hypothetical protein
MWGGYEPECNPDEEEFVPHFPLIYKNLFSLFLIQKNTLYFFSDL